MQPTSAQIRPGMELTIQLHICQNLLPSPAARRDWKDLAPSSNKHAEMDGSHISQLQLAARFGEITFPGTNWEPILEIKGTAH